MRVAIVINTAWNIYNFRLGLAKALLAEGHEVVAIAPEDNYISKLEEEGIKYKKIIMENKGSNPFQDYKLYKLLLATYKEVSPDIILQYTIKPNIFGTLAASKLGIPVINNVSGLGTVFIRSNIVSLIAKMLYKFSFRKAQKVFFQNEDDRTLFTRKGLIKEQKTDILPGSGINLERFQPLPISANRNPFNFLMISRTLIDKGIMEYGEASKILKEKGLNCSVKLIGFHEAPPLGIKDEIFNEWQSEKIIEYLGTTDQIEDYIKDAHCIVLPSYREGTPRSLLEAAACGRPIVTTNVPGCREVVFDNFNGFLCQVKDAQSLAEKMEQMVLLSEEKLSTFATNSRLLVEEVFDEKIVIKKYLEAIKELTQ